MSLSHGAIEQINANNKVAQPVLQVMEVNKVQSAQATATDRYRLIVSDGSHYMQGMLATQQNALVAEGQIKAHTVVKLNEYIINDVQGRRLIIMLDLKVQSQEAGQIGNPTQITATAAPAAPAAAPAAAPPAAPMQRPNNPVAPVGFNAAAGDADRNIHPIDSLNPYQNRWTIKARVTSKSDIKTWNKPTASGGTNAGKLFSVDLLDARNGEIRATFFKDAVDQYFDMLQEGGVYYFSGGKVKVANKRFTACNHEYELMFDPGSDISPAQDDQAIGQISFAFKRIAELENVPEKSMVDVLGVVTQAGDCAELTSKAGKQYTKRDLTLVDESNCEIRLTLWGDKAATDDAEFRGNPVFAFKGVQTSDYGGKSLSTFGSTTMLARPDIPEAQQLAAWFAAQAGQMQTRSLSSSGGGGGGGGMGSYSDRATVSDIKDRTLGYGPKPDYITVKGTIQNIFDSNAWYPACPADGCNKKLVQNVSGQWHCAKCDKPYEKPQNRYILSIRIYDHTALTYSTLFDDEAKVLLNGVNADEMETKQAEDPAGFSAVLQAANLTSHVFRLRVKAEEYNGETRVKAQVCAFEPIDYVQESRDLLAAIAAF